MGRSQSPYLTRFLADFTLGFADGLTVPAALAAGLSSLGRADTVIYAGMAELCAGSVSMGVSGYLSAVDELPSTPSTSSLSRSASSVTASRSDSGDEEELKSMLHDPLPSATSTSSDGTSPGTRASIGDQTVSKSSDEMMVLRHLEPLALPRSVTAEILTALRRRPDGLVRAALELHESHRPSVDDEDPFASARPLPPSPIATGLSISLGYVVGGIIPLLPYFFAPTVGLGLGWSIGLCLVALFTFGSGKSWLLRGKDATWRRCIWQGIHMLMLGSLATGAAVLCVRLLGNGPAEAGSSG